jgi:hypothetical protein
MPGGIMIDVRPISVDTPLLILTSKGWKVAGLPDQSVDRIHDLAANGATRAVVHKQLFRRLKQKYFKVYHYWDDLDDLKDDIDGRWKDEIIISNEIWRQAEDLYNQGIGQRRIKLLFRKKITVSQKVR